MPRSIVFHSQCFVSVGSLTITRMMKIGFMLLLLGSHGCSWLVSSQTKVDLQLIAVGNMNPDLNGRPSPIVLRLIELKAPGAFESADFFALYNHEKDTLGADWVAREEIELKPGDMRNLKFAVAPESAYVAIIAGYRDLERTNWRIILPLMLSDKNAFTLILNAQGVALAKET